MNFEEVHDFWTDKVYHYSPISIDGKHAGEVVVIEHKPDTWTWILKCSYQRIDPIACPRDFVSREEAIESISRSIEKIKGFLLEKVQDVRAAFSKRTLQDKRAIQPGKIKVDLTELLDEDDLVQSGSAELRRSLSSRFKRLRPAPEVVKK